MDSSERAVTTYFPFMKIREGSRVTIRTEDGEELTGVAVRRVAVGGRPRWELEIDRSDLGIVLASMKNTVRVEREEPELPDDE